MNPHARPVFPLRVANNKADPLRTHVSHTLDHGTRGGQKIRSSAQHGVVHAAAIYVTPALVYPKRCPASANAHRRGRRR
jgi:hypothetical protein